MEVIKKWRIVLLIVVMGLLTYFISTSTHSKISESNAITITVNKVKDGYGYTLMSNNKVLIKQEYIPAIQEKKAFCNVEDAKKVANIVKRKITRKKNPTVSLDDLKKLNINFNCVGLH